MRSKHKSLLLWCSICLFVIFTFLPMVLFSTDSRMDRQRESFASLIKHWEIAFGPASPAEANWLPLDEKARADLSKYNGTIWLQRPMPDLTYAQPYLFLSFMKRFEVFLDEEKIYSFNMDNRYRYLHPARTLHPILIDPDIAGKHLLIRAEWERDSLFGHDLALIGEMDQLFYALILSELAYILYGILGITAGVIGLAMFIRRRERIYGYFSLFCAAAGGGLLFYCRSLQWFVDMKEIFFMQLLLIPLAIWACMGFYASTLEAGRHRYIRIVHYAIGLYIAAFTVIAALAPEFYRHSAAAGTAVISVAVFATVTWVLVHHSRLVRAHVDREGEKMTEVTEEQQWLRRGYWTFAPGALVSIILSMFPETLTWLLNDHRYIFRVVEGMLPNVLLLFIICMVMAVVGRVRRVYLVSESNASELLVKNKELEQFHRNLEQLVETRTAELERANRTLAMTMREKAETLADMSVLEERNRIAYEMHDVVGHTLTAAIVQLEATRKLADREGGIPPEKLELLDELVRKGLNDIRKTVRLMKSDEDQPLSLEASLRELIQFAEDTMEVRIDSDIVLPRELSLGKLTEGVLYHALQEGLTNGIRHGRSSRFRFTLKREDKQLRFLLVSDGEPFVSAAPGFGLNSMMKRVELLGGSVALRSSKTEDGSPDGCELTILLPLS